MLWDGDDSGRWLQQQKQPATWTRLLPARQERLTALGVQPAQALPPAPAASRGAKGPSKAQQAFQRGLAAPTQWVEREGAVRPVPRAHGEEITVEGETAPVIVKLGVWVSNTKTRRHKLDADQLAALTQLGVDWA
ncbi:Helicase associated domain protein [Streptomyces sp. NPDC090085]|uniref:Helicase associated domain protein n=1 Tax=Streptomyces sp. NPDC090085 TaxID=3365943 RepID=UPI00382FB4DE